MDDVLHKLIVEYNVADYEELLIKDGYTTFDDFKDLTVDDLTDIGITKKGHLKRFKKLIAKLNEGVVEAGAHAQQLLLVNTDGTISTIGQTPDADGDLSPAHRRALLSVLLDSPRSEGETPRETPYAAGCAFPTEGEPGWGATPAEAVAGHELPPGTPSQPAASPVQVAAESPTNPQPSFAELPIPGWTPTPAGDEGGSPGQTVPTAVVAKPAPPSPSDDSTLTSPPLPSKPPEPEPLTRPSEEGEHASSSESDSDGDDLYAEGAGRTPGYGSAVEQRNVKEVPPPPPKPAVNQMQPPPKPETNGTQQKKGTESDANKPLAALRPGDLVEVIGGKKRYQKKQATIVEVLPNGKYGCQIHGEATRAKFSRKHLQMLNGRKAVQPVKMRSSSTVPSRRRGSEQSRVWNERTRVQRQAAVQWQAHQQAQRQARRETRHLERRRHAFGSATPIKHTDRFVNTTKHTRSSSLDPQRGARFAGLRRWSAFPPKSAGKTHKRAQTLGSGWMNHLTMKQLPTKDEAPTTPP